jgi:hypothetical protein
MSTTRIDKKVPAQKREKMLIKNFRNYTAKRDHNVDLVMDDCKIDKWYIRYHNMDDEFKGGEYLAELYANDNPFLPPKILYHTPNGVYQTNTLAICTTMSTYHADEYPAVLGMGGFAVNMMTAMVNHKDLKYGTNIIQSSVAEKTRLAKASRAYNRKHHADILSKFKDTPHNQPLLDACALFSKPIQHLLIEYIDLP